MVALAVHAATTDVASTDFASTDVTATNAVPVTTPDADALVAAHSGLAYRIANVNGRRHPWLLDDFVSDGLLALLKAARRFDPARAKGMSFERFARFQVEKVMIDRLRRERARNPLSFAPQLPPGGVADGGTANPLLLARDRHDDLATLELDEMLAALPPDRGTAVRRHFLDAETHVQIAAGQGVSERTAGIRVRRGVEMLRETYAA